MGNPGLASVALKMANRLVGPLDRLATARVATNAAPLMVVGLPRSGTTLAYELLVQAFEVAYLTRIYSYAYGLPNSVTRAIARGIRSPRASYTSNYGRIPGRLAPAENAVFWDRWLPRTPNLGHFVPPAALSKTANKDAFSTLSSMAAIARRPYVFKNVYMTLSLQAFLRLVPDARVIVVTRDLNTNIASIYNKRRSLQGWWSIKPPFTTDVINESILSQTVFQCVRSQQILDDSLETLPAERCLVADYESVCSSPESFVRRVANWAGSALHYREMYEIPDAFTASKGPGLEDESVAEANRLRDLHERSRDRYLSRVRDEVAKQYANG